MQVEMFYIQSTLFETHTIIDNFYQSTDISKPEFRLTNGVSATSAEILEYFIKSKSEPLLRSDLCNIAITGNKRSAIAILEVRKLLFEVVVGPE